MGGIEVSCPLCGATFDDDERYASHLSAAHELSDDDGAQTSVAAAHASAALVVQPGPGDDAAAPEAAAAIPANRIYDRRKDDARWRPVLVLTVLALLVGGAGFGLSTRGGGSGEVNDVAAAPSDDAAAGTTAEAAPPTETAAPPKTASTGTAEASTAPAGPAVIVGQAAPAPTTAATNPPATAPPATTTTAPAPTTTAPPATTATTAPAFNAPQAGSGRLDGCTKNGGTVTWRYSYTLSGGSGWQPAAGATSLGGGRYGEVRQTRASDGLTVSSVQVLDGSGAAHSVTLQPAIVADHCRG